MSDSLIWFMLLPIAGAAVIWWFTGHRKDSFIPAGIFLFVSVVAVAISFGVSHGSAVSDVEIWNGQVTSKERVHGSYQRSYDCRCRSVQRCSGSGQSRSCTSDRVCDTCYEDRYTVHWYCNTTIGRYTIDSEDTTFRSVYNKPNPPRYDSINVGDPVSKTNTYTNYVQAVPESLFRPAGESLKRQFAPLLPAYPDKVYDFYRVDRFLTPGYSSPDAPTWNASISELLKERGPRKQVNAIVVVAKTNDPNYAYALRDHWEGANKNDVVLVIGSAEWPRIDFVEVISWTKNELFKVQLRDQVKDLGTIQREPILKVLATQIDTNFERRRMREFEYLKGEISPPMWLLGTLIGFMLAGGAALIFFFNRANRFSSAYGAGRGRSNSFTRSRGPH